MSSTEMYSQVVPASGRIDLGPGNFLLGLTTSSGTLNLRIQTARNLEGISGAAGNALIRRIEPWRYAFIEATVGATVVFIFGTLDNTEEDITDVRAVVTSITGTVNVAATNETLAASPAQATRATGGADTVAANAARKRVVISVISGTGPLFLQSTGAGANRGIPIQTGQSYSHPSNLAFDLRNDGGDNVVYNVQEIT